LKKSSQFISQRKILKEGVIAKKVAKEVFSEIKRNNAIVPRKDVRH